MASNSKQETLKSQIEIQDRLRQKLIDKQNSDIYNTQLAYGVKIHIADQYVRVNNQFLVPKIESLNVKCMSHIPPPRAVTIRTNDTLAPLPFTDGRFGLFANSETRPGNSYACKQYCM